MRAFSWAGTYDWEPISSVAAGPVGRTVEADVTPVATVYAYSLSQGIFGGISLEGTVITARSEANAQYYGGYVEPARYSFGEIRAPGRGQAAPKSAYQVLEISKPDLSHTKPRRNTEKPFTAGGFSRVFYDKKQG